MAKPGRRTAEQDQGLTHGEALADERDPDLPGSWGHYPADQAEENVGYQKLAWYAAPFGTLGLSLVVLAVVVNGLKTIAAAALRLLLR